MSGVHGANRVWSGRHLTRGRAYERTVRRGSSSEWDFRAVRGSRIGGSLVAMWTASGGAGVAAVADESAAADGAAS
jgi:hypothetical protein